MPSFRFQFMPFAAIPKAYAAVQKNAAFAKEIRYSVPENSLILGENNMTPVITLTITAQTMQAASAVIGQQMRLAEVMIDQAAVAQRALMQPYSAGSVTKPVMPAKVKKKVAKKAVVAKAKPKAPKLVEVVAPKKAAPVAKAEVETAPAKQAVVSKLAAVAAPSAPKVEKAPVAKKAVLAKKAKPTPKAAPKKKVDVAPKASAAVTKAPEAKPTAVKPTPEKLAATSVPAKVAKTVASKVEAPASKPKTPKRAKDISVSDAPWDGKPAPKKA